MEIPNDKYILTSVAIILVLAALCLTAGGSEDTSDNVTGIVTSVQESSNGKVFYITDSDGETTKCFTSSDISVGDLCTVRGSFSDDGAILFVSKLTLR